MPKILSFNQFGNSENNNIFRYLWEQFLSLDKFTKIALLIFFLFILVTPFIVTQYLQIRQQATGEQVQLYFTQHGSTAPLTNLTLAPGEQTTLDLYLSAQTTNVNGFDIATVLSDNLALVSPPPIPDEGTDASRFNSLLFNTWANNRWRFTKVNTNTSTSSTIVGDFYLATIPIKAISAGSGTLNFLDVTVVSPQSDNALTVGKQNLAITIVAPTTIPTPTASVTPVPSSTIVPTRTPTPTVTMTPVPTRTPASPTPTRIPIPTVTAVPIPVLGDIDRDGCVGIADFALWAQAFQAGETSGLTDLNTDGKIDILDFNVWYQAVRSGVHVCP